jgi:very-short-patch-repair endonuclease
MMRSRVIERNMFYGAGRNIFEKATELRNNTTDAEDILWNELKNREVFKVKFRRQHPIDIFIADFYCHKYKLVVEVDGEIHSDIEVQERDDGRAHDIEKLGIKILRFTNSEIMTDIQTVKQRILDEINSHNTPESRPERHPQTP